MKKLVIFSLVTILLLPLLTLGCTTETTTAPPTQTTVPASNGGEEAQIIELDSVDFSAQKDIVKDIELIRPGSLIVRMISNPSTGFLWGDAQISDPSAIVQASHNFVGPEDTSMIGASGTEVWVFDSRNAGSATLKFSYSRPWEGGEKDLYTLIVNVTVK